MVERRALVHSVTRNGALVQEQGRLYGSLYALRILTRKYEFKDEEERVPLGGIVDGTFPVLLRIFQVQLYNGFTTHVAVRPDGSCRSSSKVMLPLTKLS